jgi:hypothetical protein
MSHENFFKKVLLILIFALFSKELRAQEIINAFNENSFSEQELAMLKSTYGQNKTLIKDYEKQILITLSYFPELKDVNIIFRERNRKTPLATRPTFLSMFRQAKKRSYIITISNKSTNYLNSIIFKNLTFNAQIGVLSHELAHISDYLNKGFGKMLVIAKNELFCPKAVDALEYSTDLSSINHGLGYQLLEWSTNVRVNLKRENWLGAVNLSEDKKSERYMNPSTITEIISKHPLYQKN